MAAHLSFGQHPARSLPLASWPTYARVGVVSVGPSSAARRKYRIVIDEPDLQEILEDDQDFLELITIMAETGIFD